MEAYSCYNSNISKNPKEKISNSKQSIPSYFASLHSIQKDPKKPLKKLPIAPFPPTPPKIYKVDPINFRDLVQKLTAAPEFLQTRRLQNSASTPLLNVNVTSHDPFFNNSNEYTKEVAPVEIVRPMPINPSSLSVMYREFSEALGSCDNNSAASNFLGLNLSPSSSYNWCSFPRLSPGTTTSFLEQKSTVL